MAQRSLFGVTYWPLRKGPMLWRAFDRAEVRYEFQQLAALGATIVRLPIIWADIQPRKDRLDGGVMRALEQTLDAASDAHLRVMPALFVGAALGGLFFPRWATTSDISSDLLLTMRFGPLLRVSAEPRAPIIYDGALHETDLRDLYTEPAMREAQRYLIGEVLGYFAGHPAVWGWELGSGWEHGRPPASSDAVAEWAGTLIEQAREIDSDVIMTYGASLRSLTRQKGPRPEHLAQSSAIPSISLAPPLPVQLSAREYPSFVAFVAALVTALTGRRPIVSGLGLPVDIRGGHGLAVQSEAFGVPITLPLLDEEEHAVLIADTLEAAARQGAPVALLAHAFDYPESLWSAPPLAMARAERGMGVLRDDGSERPAVVALRMTPPEPAPQVIEVDPEEYWRNPALHLRRLWAEWRDELEC